MSERPDGTGTDLHVAVLHAYSADNLGDGLLVEQTLELLDEAFPDRTVRTKIFAVRPETFAHIDASFVSSRPTSPLAARTYLRELRGVRHADLVVAVGGGYLRFGTVREAVKTALAHLPQLRAAARTHAGVIYLPQSIGPASRALRPVVGRRLRNVDAVFVRDDRSAAEFARYGATRTSDLAVAAATAARRGEVSSQVPVLSVRHLHGTLPQPVHGLSRRLGVFDGYVQSVTGDNDDTAAMRSVHPRGVLTRAELLDAGRARVVVAMRLHAALMALAAGHYVVHLAYERKGFGAFADLGLSDFAHKAMTFEPDVVLGQVQALLRDPAARADYAAATAAAHAHAVRAHTDLVTTLRQVQGKPA